MDNSVLPLSACFTLGIFLGYKLNSCVPIRSLMRSFTQESTKLVLVVRDDLKMSKGKYNDNYIVM